MSNEKEAAFMPALELPSGVYIRPDRIVFIARKELNQYMIVLEGAGIAPTCTGTDIDFLKQLGVIQGLVREDAPVAANDVVVAKS